MADKTLQEYSRTITDPLIVGLMQALATGDASLLRNTPEGRAFLLEEALKRRKIPLAIRSLPRIMGEAARRTVEKMELDILTEWR